MPGKRPPPPLQTTPTVSRPARERSQPPAHPHQTASIHSHPNAK